MDILGIFAGFLVSGIALFFWYKIHRSVTRGEEFRIWPARKSPLLEEESSAAIETFVAAYRSGNADKSSAPPLASPRPVAQPEAHAPAATKPPTATNPPAASTAQGEAFLSGAVKVAYLSIKSGLRDHHVFVHVDMAKLPGYGPAESGATRATLDLLVCNAAMKPVAGIDMIGADSGPADPGKLSRLRALDIRYLRLSVKSLPKPEAVRALLYRA